ncbi:glycosyl transferase group 2 family protein [Gemmatirosa kalamazoonensis]|uniref:Glycosyl transferase group 2 family protein n=1 Tax=Gemmatirosa kalamazoonensis TaxID=861299 RepID=W0RB34_9BACT|nr:glycosyltransferase family 2 protein [Gemmatirosa kalamazoonensis]AHG87672.1 glycosyl transferase group 2 family protein [Gemmatirosa kalamazoonensis]
MTLPGLAAAMLLVAAVPPTAAALYLGVLALLARRAAPADATGRGPATRFDVIVPAHDEESGIAATIASLRALDYPSERYRVVVVADNCTDATAECARAAGALVWERNDAERRGKGYALAHGFAASVEEGFAEAVVVVDADTTVSPNLLRELDAALARGADALQASYGIRNPDASWRTRLLTLGFTLFHDIRSLARERLRLSSGLRGNGMCFHADLLRRVPHRAFSIVEDLEYGLQLGLAGVRVAYVGAAHVYGDMPSSTDASRSQRARWERGRRAVGREYAGRLLREAVRRRDVVLLDLLLDVVVPPLSRLVAALVVGWTVAVAAAALGAPAASAVAVWTVGALAIVVYLARGCALTGNGLRAAADLVYAPVYMLWKLTVAAGRATRNDEWVRTSRAVSANRGGA